MQSLLARLAGLGLSVLLLQACSTANPDVALDNPDAPLTQDFVAGKIELQNSFSLAGMYGSKRHELKSDYQSQQWRALATTVIKVGYLTDQSFFYLGAAAEGMGYLPAARIYYNRAKIFADLHHAAISCSAVLNNCDGEDIAALASAGLQRVGDANQNVPPPATTTPAFPVAAPVTSDTPPYPASLAGTGIQGSVDLEFDVTPQGQATNVKVVAVTGSNLFSLEALSWAENKLWQPDTVNGVAVGAHRTFHANFQPFVPSVYKGPIYPQSLVETMVQGSADVACDTDDAGHNHNCKVIAYTGSSLFGDSALAFAESQIVAQQYQNGIAIPLKDHRKYHFNFSLK